MPKWIRSPRVLAVASAAALLAGNLTFAQAPTQTPAQTSETTTAATPEVGVKPPATSVEARLVNLPTIVRDKKGGLIQNLTKDDFSLEVDGHPQTIRYFDKDANLPLTLGLLVDVSRSVSSALNEERSASEAFLDKMLASDKDQAFVVQFAREAELLQDVTNSRPKLRAALQELATDTSSAAPITSPDDTSGSGEGRRRGAGGTTLYDAAFLSADELMSRQQGRKALVVLTDGDDRGSKETLVEAIEAAQKADTIVYAIYFKGDSSHMFSNDSGYPGGGRRGGIGFPGGGNGYPGGGGYPGGYPGGGGQRRGGNPGDQTGQGKRTLERMTAETGGRMFEISKKHSVGDIYNEIAEELRSQYRIGFTPTQQAAYEGYHQVGLLVPKDKNLYVQTRAGYYGHD